MPTLLVTGFEPFHIHKHNPSALAAESVAGQRDHWTIKHLILPVVPRDAGEQLVSALHKIKPDAVLLIGLSARAAHMTLERVAVNMMDFAIPDNSGEQYTDTAIFPDGPDAYLSSLPLRKILADWKSDEIPGKISNTAGLYVCNSLFYYARHALTTSGRTDVPCGFLHVPANAAVALNTDKELPYLPQSEINRAVFVATESIIQFVNEKDSV